MLFGDALLPLKITVFAKMIVCDGSRSVFYVSRLGVM